MSFNEALNLPLRITTPEVCGLARFSKSTLWKRIDAGQMPAPIDRGGGGFIFDRDAVLKALGVFEASASNGPDWSFDEASFLEAHKRKIDARTAARRRQIAAAKAAARLRGGPVLVSSQ